MRSPDSLVTSAESAEAADRRGGVTPAVVGINSLTGRSTEQIREDLLIALAVLRVGGEVHAMARDVGELAGVPGKEAGAKLSILADRGLVETVRPRGVKGATLRWALTQAGLVVVRSADPKRAPYLCAAKAGLV